MMENKYFVKGTFIDTPNYDRLRVRKGFILVEGGKVVSFFEDIDNKDNLKVYDFSSLLIIPGLIDLHLHAPQYNFVGTAMDLELMDWLNAYTFPEESKFCNLDYSKRTYGLLVKDLLSGPTTRACIFSSIYTDSTLQLMDLLEEKKFIAYVGKVGMDRNSPDYYVEKDGINETIRYLEETKKRNYQFVRPIITPRFTPSVSDEYMEQLGKIAIKYNVPCQSHLSENNGEIEFVKELRPQDRTYAESYDKYGLFGKPVKTVMAHCIHCDELEQKMLKDNGVYIAHCPTSNVNLLSGICPSAMYLRNGFHIGIGSDIAGGNTLDLFQVMQSIIQSSKARYKYISQEYEPLTLPEVLYMATVGGGSFFGKVGLFEEGYEFDAVVIDDKELITPREYNESERIERLIYLNKGKVSDKFIKGNKVL